MSEIFPEQPPAVSGTAPGRAAYEARGHLGRIVRETWVKWAREQPDPKPSWLVPWDELDDGQREADMRIGEAVAQAAAVVPSTIIQVQDELTEEDIARLRERFAAAISTGKPEVLAAELTWDEDLRRERDEAREQLAAAMAETRQLRDVIAVTERERDKARGERNEARAELAGTRERLAQVERERDQARERLTGVLKAVDRVAVALEVSAGKTEPSKKSDIERQAARRIRDAVQPLLASGEGSRS